MSRPKVNCAVNVPDEDLAYNVIKNIKRGLPQVQPFNVQSEPIALVGGGPSLEDTFEDLKEKYDKGMKVVSTNGTHDWLIERGIRPSAHVQIDARDFNARFVENWIPECKYLIASQAHPKVFDTLEGANVHIFHCASNRIEAGILHGYYLGNYYTVVGGSTVVLRSIPLLRMLGFDHVEIYGFDSCYLNEKHHAYKQEENDGHRIAALTADGRSFDCSLWMYSQAVEFIDMTKKLGHLLNLIIHGDGLIAHMVKSSAMRVMEKK